MKARDLGLAALIGLAAWSAAATAIRWATGRRRRRSDSGEVIDGSPVPRPHQADQAVRAVDAPAAAVRGAQAEGSGFQPPDSPKGRLVTRGRTLVGVVWDTVAEWIDDKAPRQAAALAFYTMLALSPLLIIAVGIAGVVLGEGETRRRVIEQVEQNAGPQVSDAVTTVLANASRPGASATAFLIGGALLLFGASGAVRQLKGALNAIWNVEPSPQSGTWNKVGTVILTYAYHLLLVMVFALGLLALLATTSAWGWVAGRLRGSLPDPELLLRVLDFGVTLALLTLVFAAVFKGLPDVEIEWRDLWAGAFATALLFDVGRLAIGLYVGGSATTSAYGAAGSVVALQLWVYYSALIVLFGAELTQVRARRLGRALTARRGARTVVRTHA